MAQPVPLRPVPAQPWGRILAGAFLLLVLLVSGWEAYWRAYGVTPGIRNTFGLWAIQRRRIDAGESDATVLLGASRTYFDIQLPVWERLARRAPIQLSYEGTSPLTAVEDLAADPKFSGRLFIGVSPELFFSGGGFAVGVAKYAHKQSPAQRVGQWLSMNFIEPYFAFDDADFALRPCWRDSPGRSARADIGLPMCASCPCTRPTATPICGARSNWIPSTARSPAASGRRGSSHLPGRSVTARDAQDGERAD